MPTAACDTAPCCLTLLPAPHAAPSCSYYLDSKQAAPAEGEADDDAGAAAAAAARARARHVDAGELLREAEEAAGDAGMEMLDAKGLKRLTLQLERKVRADGRVQGCGVVASAGHEIGSSAADLLPCTFHGPSTPHPSRVAVQFQP